jgi:phosphoribosylformimino-5-aminoimidazole carboxamide ribotide isomerase
MRIIPAIDIINGQCVRLTQGDYQQKKIYSVDPLAVAKSFEDAGLRHLHLVDLDGAKNGAVTNWNVVRDITSKTNLAVDFGGGIKTEDEIQKLLDLGVKQVNLGSIAVKQPELVRTWLKTFGPEKIILSADVKNELVQISGWIQNSQIKIEEFVTQYIESGIQYVTCTDINTDGMLTGPNISLYKKLKLSFPSIHWIASGGVSSLNDLAELANEKLFGVIVGKAIYENRFTLTELSSDKFN